MELVQSRKVEGFCAYSTGAHYPAPLEMLPSASEGVEGSSFSLSFFFAAGASQVKWNKKNANCLATSHDGDVRIWDKRVSNLSFSPSWSLITPRGYEENVVISRACL